MDLDRYKGVPLGVEAIPGIALVELQTLYASERNEPMKRITLALSLAAAALSGCAQLADRADTGATAAEEQRPYPKPRYNENFLSW